MIFIMCLWYNRLVFLLQRLGVYNQHAADQLELKESPVEYLQVVYYVRTTPVHYMNYVCTDLSVYAFK